MTADARRYFNLPSPFAMHRGGELRDARLAYETWGTLDDNAGNAVLILPGMSPDAHAASHADNPAKGWWEDVVGPGKAIDTERFFVICVNSLGSCKGSTGPASINPATGELYRLDFPALTLEDVADSAHALVQSLGITQLAALVGCSMGGMASLAWLLRHPDSVRSHLSISTAPRAQPFAIAIRSLQREAIRLDRNWIDGHYSEEAYPVNGMAVARKLGVITYRSAMEWNGRFARIRLDPEDQGDEPFGLEFQVESYLEAHARRFIHSFDPNCYLYLSRASDWFDAGDYADGNVLTALASIHIERALVLGVRSDILFPLQQQEDIATGLAQGKADVRFSALDSPQGHDAFLVDMDRFVPEIKHFMASVQTS